MSRELVTEVGAEVVSGAMQYGKAFILAAVAGTLGVFPQLVHAGGA